MSVIMFISCLLIYGSENVYSVQKPKELFELKRSKSKLQIQYSVKEGRLNSHVYPPSLLSPHYTVIKWIKGYKFRKMKRTEKGFSRKAIWTNHWMLESGWRCRHWFIRAKESRPHVHAGSTITLVETVHTAESLRSLAHSSSWYDRWRVEAWNWTRKQMIRLSKFILSPRNGTLTTKSFQLPHAHHEQNTDAYNTPPTLPIITTGDQSFIYEWEKLNGSGWWGMVEGEWR